MHGYAQAAEQIARFIYSRYPDFKGLVFIEGVVTPSVTSRVRDTNPTWWGGNLQGVSQAVGRP